MVLRPSLLMVKKRMETKMTNINSNTVTVWRGKADGTLGSRVDYATGAGPIAVKLADLDHNGVLDLVVANDFDNSVTIALQNADGTFSTLTRAVGAGPSDIAVANLGGVYGTNIAVTDQVSGDVTILYNDADHTFAEETRYRAGTGLFDIGGRTAATGVGVYNLSGGTLTAAADIRIGSSGTGTMNQSGGTVIANGGYDARSGNAAIAHGEADLIAFGVPFLANPDLPLRYLKDAPLNTPDGATFYAGEEKGYVDYPALVAGVAAQ